MMQMLTRRQFAALLCISLRTFAAMDAAGKLPKPVLIGSGSLRPRKRWLRAEVDEWLKAGAPNRARWDAMQ